VRKSLIKKSMLLVVVGLLVFGIASATAAKKDTLIFGISHTPPTLDQDIQIDPLSFFILQSITETGVGYPVSKSKEPEARGIGCLDFTGKWKLEPRLFESWERSSDGKRTIIHLRKGVKSAYGHEWTAKDFLYRFKRAEVIKGFGQVFLTAMGTNYDSLRAIDKYTVEMVSKSPNALHLLLQGIPSDGFWDSAECEKHATPDDPWVRDWMKHHAPMFGPYYIKEWSTGKQIILEANPYYWKGEPKIKRIIWKVIPESSMRVTLIEKGVIDVALELSPREVNSLKGVPGVIPIKVKKAGYQQALTMNQKVFEPFKSKLVRQALNYAVPRDEIVETVYYGGATISITSIRLKN